MSFDFNDVVSQIPVIGGALDDTRDKGMSELEKNQALFGGIDIPQQNYTPEDYRYVGSYDPQNYSYQTVNEDPMIRSAQMSALAKMSGLADTGLSDVDKQGYDQARQIGAQQSRSGVDAALANAQARHVGGSGLEFAMREMADQGGAQRAQQGALQQAADSARQRALYQQAYGSALEGARNQDYRTQAGNTDIINRFNQMNTQNQNAAAQYNLSQRQQMSNMNTQNHNAAQQYRNQLGQNYFGNQMAKAGGEAGANNMMAQGWAAQNAANTDARNRDTAMAYDYFTGGPAARLLNGGGGGDKQGKASVAAAAI